MANNTIVSLEVQHLVKNPELLDKAIEGYFDSLHSSNWGRMFTITGEGDKDTRAQAKEYLKHTIIKIIEKMEPITCIETS